MHIQKLERENIKNIEVIKLLRDEKESFEEKLRFAEIQIKILSKDAVGEVKATNSSRAKCKKFYLSQSQSPASSPSGKFSRGCSLSEIQLDVLDEVQPHELSNYTLSD